MSATECARYTRDSGNIATVAVPITAAVAVGKRVVLAVNGAALNAATSFSATDSKGNTYTQRAFAVSAVAAVDGQIAIISGAITTALTTSDTISVTCNTRSPDKWCAIGLAVDDIAGGYDVSATNTGTTGTALATGTTGAAAQDRELLVAAFGFTDATAARTLTMAGWTQLTKATASPASSPRSLILAYQYIQATGTRAGTGTLSSAEAWVGAISAYKQDAPPSQAFCYLYNGTTDVAMDVTVA